MEPLFKVVAFLEELFPPELSLENDPIGLVVKPVSLSQPIEKVLVALELNPSLVHTVVEEEYDLLYLHHPPIWNPIKKLDIENPYVSMLLRLYQNGVTVLSHHTNLDCAPEGLADQWIELLELQGKKKPLFPHKINKQYFKITTFVPQEHLDRVAQAAFQAGAGIIGNYSECSFYTEGIGTFTPQKGANPFIGEAGNHERVRELRFEVRVEENLLAEVLHAIFTAHPYEEPAVDVYPLFPFAKPDAGLGRLIELDNPISLEALSVKIERLIDEKILVQKPYSKNCENVVKIAILPGSGKSFLNSLNNEKVDLFISGDLSHHDIEELKIKNISFIQLPHGRGERIAMQSVTNLIQKKAMEKGLKVTFESENRYHDE
jgi:dinuclear metal center YbgI/SA1388 family protein